MQKRPHGELRLPNGTTRDRAHRHRAVDLATGQYAWFLNFESTVSACEVSLSLDETRAVYGNRQPPSAR